MFFNIDVGIISLVTLLSLTFICTLLFLLCCIVPLFCKYLGKYTDLKPADVEMRNALGSVSPLSTDFKNMDYSSVQVTTDDFDNPVPIWQVLLVPPLCTTYSTRYDRMYSQLDNIQQKPLSYIGVSVIFVINNVILLSIAMVTILQLPHFAAEIHDHWEDVFIIITGIVITMLLILLLAFSLIAIIVNYAKYILRLMLLTGIVFYGISSILCLMSANIIPFICFGILCVFNFFYMQGVMDRVPFASTLFATASQAIRTHYVAIFTAAFLCLLLQIIWTVICALAGYSLRFILFHSHPFIKFITALYLLLSWYWAIQTSNTVMQSVIAGTVACWWFQPDRPAPVRGSLLRALYLQFGSLSLASLLIAPIRITRDILVLFRHIFRSPPERVNPCSYMLTVLNYMLNYVDTAMSYFNTYGVAYIAGYHNGLVAASRNTTNLFRLRLVILRIIGDI